MKIIKINEFEGVKLVREIDEADEWETFMGYEVETDDGFITIAVNDVSSCCESFDAVNNLPHLDYFNGAEVIDIRAVETDEDGNWKDSKSLLKELGEYGPDVLEAGFIKIVTDKDTFDMGVYNNHNGYYGHTVIVKKSEKSILRKQ